MKEIKSLPEYHTLKTWHGWFLVLWTFVALFLLVLLAPVVVWQEFRRMKRPFVKCTFCPTTVRRPAFYIFWLLFNHIGCNGCGRTYHKEWLIEVASADAHKDKGMYTDEELVEMVEYEKEG